MSDKLRMDVSDLRPRITVIGVGGAGCNAVNNMIDANLGGVDFVVANTDAQALAVSHAGLKVQLGTQLTEGLGAGSRPEIGEAAAEEALDEIRNVVKGSHMVFVAAGMGGGTGTGAAAVIARVARELGILTVAVVTKPFQFEGSRRMRIAEAGIVELRQHVDTLIVIPNQNLFRIASERTTFAEAFVLADQVLYSGVACIVDLIVKEGLINLDFADVRTVMSGMGSAMMGTGEAAGEGRAIRAAEEAITNPLLDDVTLAGAKGLLLSITGGSDLTLYEVDEAATRVRQEVDPDANIIVGATFDGTMGDRVRVSIVASGMARGAMDATGTGTGSATLSRPAARSEGSAAGGGFIPAAAPPPPPAQPVPPAARDPHGLPDREQDLLADALQSQGNAAYGGPVSAPSVWSSSEASEPPPIPPPASWHATDAVEISDLPKGAYAHAGHQLPQSAFGAPPRQPASYEDFQPAAPAEVRRAPRRMPDVTDFPAVGQREYYAKTGHADGLGYEPHGAGAAPEEPRRRGFFDRLTGRGRRETDSQTPRHEPHIAAAGRTPHAGPGMPSGAGHGDGSAARASAGGAHANKPELPVFFNKTRR